MNNFLASVDIKDLGYICMYVPIYNAASAYNSHVALVICQNIFYQVVMGVCDQEIGNTVWCAFHGILCNVEILSPYYLTW